jgi:hypothetical protein
MNTDRSTARALLIGPAIVAGALAGASQAAHAATPVNQPAYVSASPAGGPGWGHDRDPRWGDRYDPRWGYYHHAPGWGVYPYAPSVGYYPYAPGWGGYWRR